MNATKGLGFAYSRRRSPQKSAVLIIFTSQSSMDSIEISRDFPAKQAL